MNVMHRLTGYDRASDALVEQHDVPSRLLPLAKSLARVADDDPEAVWSYLLDAHQVQSLAAALDVPLDVRRNEYFLEAFAPAHRSAQQARRRAS
jgi:hypothetical protein